jgi:hypothetical protein
MNKLFLLLIICITILGIITIFLEYGKENFYQTTTTTNNSNIDIEIEKNELVVNEKKYPVLKFNGSDKPLQTGIIRNHILNNNDNVTKVEDFKFKDNYTISLLFKNESPEISNRSYIISLDNQWKVFTKNNVLYLVIYNKDNDNLNIDSVNSENSIRIELNENLEENALGIVQTVKYYHLAIKSQNIDIKTNEIILFVNGLEKKIFIPPVNDNNQNLNKLFIGFDKANTNNNTLFQGNILDIQYFTNIVGADTLCSLWNSCGDIECSFTGTGRTVDECLANCKTFGCSTIVCKDKCSNIQRATFKPKCNFKPQGFTLNMCLNECQNVNNNCIFSECSEFCQNCTDTDKCRWVDRSTLHSLDPDSIDPNNLICKDVSPPSLHFTINSNKDLIITFEHPFQIDTETPKNYKYKVNTKPDKNGKEVYLYDLDIDSFIFIIYKTYDRKSGERLITYNVSPTFKDNLNTFNEDPTKDTLLTVDLKKWVPVHTKMITDLDSGEYTVICKSIKQKKGKCRTNEDITNEVKLTGDDNTISDSSYRYSINMNTKEPNQNN